MHIPVLLDEVVGGLNIHEGAIFVDVTLGSGGHTIEIAKKVGKNGRVIAFDWDVMAIKNTKERIKKNHPEIFERIIFVQENFIFFSETLKRLGIEKVQGVLADFGWRLEQIENSNYGLSFSKEGPLDMRLDGGAKQEITAADIVNTWNQWQLVDLFRFYGEEKFSVLIAKAIIRSREQKPLVTTIDLANLLEKSVGNLYRSQKIHPATRVFQALRIVVNNELENIENFLPQALAHLEKAGRLAIITFHSLEDRKVKEFFQANARGCVCPKEIPKCVCGKKPNIRLLNKKPIVSSKEEIIKNPRARSAKLRLAEKL